MLTWTVRPVTQLLVGLLLAAAGVFSLVVGIIHFSYEWGVLIVAAALLGFSLTNVVGCVRQLRAGVRWFEPSRDLYRPRWMR